MKTEWKSKCEIRRGKIDGNFYVFGRGPLWDVSVKSYEAKGLFRSLFGLRKGQKGQFEITIRRIEE